MTEENKNMNRTSRAAESRSKQERKRPWKPASSLEAPEGYKYRWIRTEVRGFQDQKNVSARLREGFEPVRADEHPDFPVPTIEDGKHEGTIGVGGLMLAKVPEEVVDERNDYYRQQTEDQMTAVDNDLLKEQHPSMPITKEGGSKVTFGGPRTKV